MRFHITREGINEFSVCHARGIIHGLTKQELHDLSQCIEINELELEDELLNQRGTSLEKELGG